MIVVVLSILGTCLLHGRKDNGLDNNQIESTFCKYGIIKLKNNRSLTPDCLPNKLFVIQ